MKQLSWNEYYSNFDSWAESTRAGYVSRLESVGSHEEVAYIANALFNESVASKLVNMAIDQGVAFDNDDIFLMEFSINAITLERAKGTVNQSSLRRKQKKEKKDDFWTGVAETMFFDTFIDDIFHKKK